MSIHGLVNPPPQANNPTIPNSSNITLSDQEASLAKTILESSKSSSSSLENKKIEKYKSEPLDEKSDNFISCYLRVKRVRSNFEMCKIKIAELLNQISMKPKELNTELSIRFRYVNSVLILSKFLTDSGKQTQIQYARDQVESMQIAAYFHASTQIASYLFKVHQGINCLDINIIRDDLLNLRRAIVLGADWAERELTEAESFFKSRWKELKDAGQLDEETYSLLNQNLKQILTEDPFRDEFIKNPELFKQVKNAPEALLKKYPHLASVSDFLSRYPEAGTIQLLDNLLTVSNLKHCINQVKTSPLPRLLLLVSPESLLTPVHAQMLKDLLIEKQSLGIAFGNEDDATTLTDAFLKDSSLILDEKSLIGVPKYLDNCGEVFFFRINPEYPVKKK